MQLTQIQGPNTGEKQVVPQGKEVNLPLPESADQNQPQGYVQHTETGEKVVVPHANTPVAVNNEVIQKPTPVEHGDTVTVNPGTEESQSYAVHAPEKKLEKEHIGSFVQKAGLNLNEEQIHALTKEIESVERKKFMLIFAIFSGALIIVFSLVFVLFFSSPEDQTQEISQLEQQVAQLQNQINESQDFEERVANLEDQIASFNANTNGSQADLETIQQQLQSIIDQIDTQGQEITRVDVLAEKLAELKNIVEASGSLQAGELALQYQQMQVQCGTNECCLESLQIMQDNNYSPANRGQCETGKKVNRLSCLDSYVWCE